MDVPLPRNPLEEASVKIARNRFKNVLKHMVQDNLMHDEASDDSDNDENKLFRSGVMKNSGISGGSTAGGKRIKVEGGRLEEKPKPQATFVMKLFDRGVDLAQFDEKTPLYPICRAWIHNKPQQNAKKAAAAKEIEKEELDISDLEMTKEEGSRDVYRLPPPEPLPIDEYGRLISFRIPPPFPRDEEAQPFDINYKEEDAPSPALLFQTHLDRWNVIRLRWREASAYNARRYQASINILRQIHESRVKQDEQAAAAANQMNQVNLENALDQQQQELEEEQQLLEQEQLEQEQRQDQLLEQDQEQVQDQLLEQEQDLQQQQQQEVEGQEQEGDQIRQEQLEQQQELEQEQVEQDQQEEQEQMETQ